MRRRHEKFRILVSSDNKILFLKAKKFLIFPDFRRSILPNPGYATEYKAFVPNIYLYLYFSSNCFIYFVKSSRFIGFRDHIQPIYRFSAESKSDIRFSIWGFCPRYVNLVLLYYPGPHFKFIFLLVKKVEEGLKRLLTPLQPLLLTPFNKKISISKGPALVFQHLKNGGPDNSHRQPLPRLKNHSNKH